MGEEEHLRVGSLEWWERGLSAGPQHALDDARWPNGEHKIAAQALPADVQVAAHFSLEASVLASAAHGHSKQLVNVTDARPDALYARNKFGQTAAHLAAWGRHISTLCVIIQLDPSIMRAADVFGHTPVHFCAWSGQLEALRMLHRLDASLVLQRTHAWSNAAHLAALSPHAHRTLSLLADIAPESLQAPDLVGMVPAQLCKAWCAHGETQVSEVEQMMSEVSMRDSCVGGAR